MRTRILPVIGSALVGAALVSGSTLLLGSLPAWAIPSASLGDATGGSSPLAATDAQSEASYNAALALMKKGDTLAAQAAAAGADAAARKSARDNAREAYASARVKLQSLTARSPTLAAAWNALGYTQRQLGSYDDALMSYARALQLRPGYPEALEYRGEAFLRLNRIPDAKQAYLDLFAANRTLADQFLGSIKTWIKVQQKSHGVDPTDVAEFDQWVQERSQIAAQTAALTRAGAAASWR